MRASSLLENDGLAAKGVIAEIRAVVGTKDSFTRMKSERDKERDTHLAAKRTERGERERQLTARAQCESLTCSRCSARGFVEAWQAARECAVPIVRARRAKHPRGLPPERR